VKLIFVIFVAVLREETSLLGFPGKGDGNKLIQEIELDLLNNRKYYIY